MPSLGLAATEADQENALNVGRMTKVWGVIQDVARSVRSVREKGQSEMAAARTAMGELGTIPRALSAAHFAAAKHLEASCPEALDEPTAAAQATTFSEGQKLPPQLEETWPDGKPSTTWESPAIAQDSIGTSHHALRELHPDGRNFADAREIARDFATQAENYKGARTEFRRKLTTPRISRCAKRSGALQTETLTAPRLWISKSSRLKSL